MRHRRRTRRTPVTHWHGSDGRPALNVRQKHGRRHGARRTGLPRPGRSGRTTGRDLRGSGADGPLTGRPAHCFASHTDRELSPEWITGRESAHLTPAFDKRCRRVRRAPTCTGRRGIRRGVARCGDLARIAAVPRSLFDPSGSRSGSHRARTGRRRCRADLCASCRLAATRARAASASTGSGCPVTGGRHGRHRGIRAGAKRGRGHVSVPQVAWGAAHGPRAPEGPHGSPAFPGRSPLSLPCRPARDRARHRAGRRPDPTHGSRGTGSPAGWRGSSR